MHANSPGRLRTGRLILATLAVVLLPAAGWMERGQAAANTVDGLIKENSEESGIVLRNDERQLLRKAVQIVQDRYLAQIESEQLVDEVFEALAGQADRIEEGMPTAADSDAAADEDPLARMDEALNSVLRNLDAHTAYLSPSAFKEMRVRTRGEFGGLGLEVTMEDNAVKVVSPIDDTPAMRAGMQAGDRITHVDGAPVLDMTLRQAVRRMRGRVGTSIVLTVERAGEPEPLRVTIVRDIIRIRAVRYRREGDVGYIRISAFSERAEDGIEEAVDVLRDDTAPSLRGLVIDLRNNPGGLLDQAVRVADAFLEDGNIVSVRGRTASDNASYDAAAGDLSDGDNIVVLVNAGSASASEIVASALQDHGRATVIGTRSFGKGSVQTIMPMGQFGAMRLTTALYCAPSGRAIQARGVRPDLHIALPDEAARQEAIRREENLSHALANPADRRGADEASTVISAERCQALLEREVEDGELACALALLRLGGIDQLASAAARL